jgi:hypothetical protein
MSMLRMALGAKDRRIEQLEAERSRWLWGEGRADR